MLPDRDRALWALMTRIRAFEERICRARRDGHAPGHVHPCTGQEAVAAGVCAALAPADVVTSAHRCHGHALAMGSDPVAMMAEVLGRATGLCGGRGGSVHLIDMERGFLGGNGIVGANAPLALGAALAARHREDGAIGVAFIGDGASNQGAVFESMNLAVALSLPCLFVIEDNGIAQFTAADRVTGTPDLAARAAAFGMAAECVDGRRVHSVGDVATDLVSGLRRGAGPATLVARVPRLGGHFEGDSSSPVPAPTDDEQDCLALYRAHLIDSCGADIADSLDRLQADAAREMQAALDSARAAPLPAPDSIEDHVHAA